VNDNNDNDDDNDEVWNADVVVVDSVMDSSNSCATVKRRVFIIVQIGLFGNPT